MKVGAMFPSTYLKSADIKGRTVLVTIASVEIEDIGGEHKPILRFRGKDKGMVLNKTNANEIMDAYGDDTDGWKGKPIELYVARVEFQGKRVDGLRVRVPENGRPQKHEPDEPPAHDDQDAPPPEEDDESTPF